MALFLSRMDYSRPLAWGLVLLGCLFAQVVEARERKDLDQRAIDRLAATIDLDYEVLQNNRPPCAETIPNCFVSRFTLKLPDPLPEAMRAADLVIYFGFVSPLADSVSDTLQTTFINGDLHRLTLKPGVSLRSGAIHVIDLLGRGAHLAEILVLPKFYLAVPGKAPRVLEATRVVTDRNTGLERLPFVAPFRDEERLARVAPDDLTEWQTPERAYAKFSSRGSAENTSLGVIPTPREVDFPAGTRVDFRRGIRLQLRGVDRGALRAPLKLLMDAGVSLEGEIPLRIEIAPSAGASDEAYTLRVGGGRVVLNATDLAGARHGLRSLVQQMIHDNGQTRPLVIHDSPRYRYRGLHLDLARNFQSRDRILRLIETIAAYKFNRLHLHLSDDEGWRIEIAKLPELTAVGSRRCHDLAEDRCLLPQLGAGPQGDPAVDGFLSQTDYTTILKAAHSQGIEIIPSIDMPGHARAAIRAMEARYRRLKAAHRHDEAEVYRLVEPADTTRYLSIQNYTDNTLNVCLDATYRFIDTVVDEIAQLHEAAGVPLKTFHLGADETAGAWRDSPACAALQTRAGLTVGELAPYFIERVAMSLAGRGLKVAGWSDGLGHTHPARMPPAVQTHVWGTLFWGGIAEAHEQTNRGWDAVLSIPDFAYFDMPYVPHPLEGGNPWATRSVDTLQVFAFQTENLAANAARVLNRYGQGVSLSSDPPLQSGKAYVGIQAQIWTEAIRSEAMLHHQLFPRLLAFADRAWYRPSWELAYAPGQVYQPADPRVDEPAILDSWRMFRGRMPAHFRLMEQLGVAYRLTPPGARLVNGELQALGEYPGLDIEYRAKGSSRWQRYTQPVRVSGAVELRTRSLNRRRSSRIVTVGATDDG